jgi:cytochrome b
MNTAERIRVWDPLIRSFHWLLVLGFTTAWLTRESDYELHLISGYAVLILIGLRILWGIFGSAHARFNDFVKGPVELLRYLGSLVRGSARRYRGHNPAGGMMIVLFLLILATLTISGVALDGAENWSGPLADAGLFRHKDLIHRIHDWSSDLMLLLIPLHLLGVLHASVVHRENLVKSMIDGYKRG